ncbi:site-specific integrase [Desulfosporosinus metallidurans]|uniref:Tyr recombinase domain-containing protein n=1 Tax=Desulfosporosinus metallidurans TaxID=1888891 RepID=A0A1Q8QFL7_9FIRM|nr:site-specific integrase [Desulfosporosinus metallidurans]OLN26111.1 hypothetical protein DSOL_5115 [Desulfosporosinus metallidurans]
MSKANVSMLKEYDEELRANLLSQLEDYGTSIDFSANKWVCDKKKKASGYSIFDVTWYFNQIPEKYREIVKYYAINDKRIQADTMTTRLSALGTFFNYLHEHCADIELRLINGIIINNFKLFLQNQEKAKATKQQVWSATGKFFEAMISWPELPDAMPINQTKNPWKRGLKDQRNDDKYIPDEVADQLDIIFYRNHNIPVTHRLIYWLLRLIPSRGCEVASMLYDCIKPLGSNRKVLTIPTWKQNGGYFESEPRMIYLKGEGIIQYLLDLIKQQQELTSRYQTEFPDNQKILFKVGKISIDSWAKKRGEEKYIILKTPVEVNAESITYFLKRYCERFNIKDRDGKPYKVTSHQFRHNGITDRIEDGFNIIEIRDMTGHKGDQMPRWAYFHPSKEKQIELQKKVNEASRPTNENENEKLPAVMFRGRIMNLDKETEQRLLKNPRAYKLRLGICTDITTCKSGIFECMACEYFVPKVEDLDYWEEMTEYWSAKVESAKKRGFTDENAEYNLAIHRAIVKKIHTALEMEANACAEETAK